MFDETGEQKFMLTQEAELAARSSFFAGAATGVLVLMLCNIVLAGLVLAHAHKKQAAPVVACERVGAL